MMHGILGLFKEVKGSIVNHKGAKAAYFKQCNNVWCQNITTFPFFKEPYLSKTQVKMFRKYLWGVVEG